MHISSLIMQALYSSLHSLEYRGLFIRRFVPSVVLGVGQCYFVAGRVFIFTLRDITLRSFHLPISGFEISALGGPMATRFGSRSAASPSGPRFFSFSALTAASFCACRRASLSLRSFSFRRAFDSNSCQSPSSFESLSIH